MKFPKTILILLISLVSHTVFAESEIDKLKNDAQVTAFLQAHFQAFSDHHHLRQGLVDVWKKEERFLKRNYGKDNFWKGDFDGDGRTDLLIVVVCEGGDYENRELISVIFDTRNGYKKIPVVRQKLRWWISPNIFPSVVSRGGFDVVKVDYIADHSLIYQSWEDYDFEALAAKKMDEIHFFYHNERFYRGKGLVKVQIDSIVIKKAYSNPHSMPAPLTSILMDFTNKKFTGQRFYSLRALEYAPVIHVYEREITQVGSLNQEALFEIKRLLAIGSFLSYRSSYRFGFCSGFPGLKLTIHYNNDQEFSVLANTDRVGPPALKRIMEIIRNDIQWEITDDPLSSQFKNHYSPELIEEYRTRE